MFTVENTDGFTDSELKILNKAAEILKNETDLFDKEIHDLLTNAFYEDYNTVSSLVNRVKIQIRTNSIYG